MNVALIQWGGLTIGKRPSTALAAIHRPTSGQPYVVLINSDGGTRFSNSHKLPDIEVLREWPDDYWPTPTERKDAKRALVPVAEDDPRVAV